VKLYRAKLRRAKGLSTKQGLARPLKKNAVIPLTRLTLNFSPDPWNFIDPLKKKNLIGSKNIEHIFVTKFVLQPVQRYGQFYG
jgi:hypothetical protein